MQRCSNACRSVGYWISRCSSKADKCRFEPAKLDVQCLDVFLLGGGGVCFLPSCEASLCQGLTPWWGVDGGLGIRVAVGQIMSIAYYRGQSRRCEVRKQNTVGNERPSFFRLKINIFSILPRGAQ